MSGASSTHGRGETSVQAFCRKSERKRHLGRTRRRWAGYIRM